MANRKLLVAIPVVLVIVAAVIVTLFFYNQGREIGFREPPQHLFNINGEGKDALARPLGVAASRGKIFVCDSKNGRVQVFSSDGEPVFSFPVTSKKRNKASNSYPVGIAVDDRGRIYVTELINRKLMVFDASGDFIQYFPSRKSKALKKPVAVTFADDKLYLTDVGSQKVKVFSIKGKLLLQFGAAGADPGELFFPNGVATLDNANILVSDSNNRRIQVFNSQGKFKQAFGQQILALPTEIAIDWLQRVHVADTFGRKISVFSKTGELLFSYSLQGKDQEQSLPHGVAIDPSLKQIYTTDRANNYVSVWGY